MKHFDQAKGRSHIGMTNRGAARILACTLLLLFTFAVDRSAMAVELKSPNGRLTLRFDLKDLGTIQGCPVYSVSFDSRPVLTESRLGLEMRDLSLARDVRVVGQETTASDTVWTPLLGERKTIRDHYNQLVIELRSTKGSYVGGRISIAFRAYDEGIAFSYLLPDAGNGRYVDIAAEATQFAFPENATGWAIYRAQADYRNSMVPIGAIKPGAERPLTVRLEDNLYASIAEARVANYARMKLRVAKGTNSTLEADLDAEPGGEVPEIQGEVTGRTPFATPWRVLMVAESPGKLLEENYLILNLNDPSELADTSWIKPGKVLREITLSTAGGKASIDFAVKHHMQYVMYDGGWYGPPDSDARAVAPALRTRLNIHEVIEYGQSRGIGVILYVDHRPLERQIDELLPLYESWGVKGVKFGFVNVGSQFWMAFLHEAIRKAATHHLMVDIHDEFRNFGYQRTYPNLMTVEGIRGNEEFPSPEHNAALPFTRFLAGPADYTYCWMDKRLKNSKAHQLALSTIYFSPWQFLYWYDKPSDIVQEPALTYWDDLPTVWDETRVLQGDIGKRAVVARRKGTTWFLGAIAPVDGNFPIALSFLPAGVKMKATIYADAPSGPGVQVEEKLVDSQSVLQAAIPSNGGLAMEIRPIDASTQVDAAAVAVKEGQTGNWTVHYATPSDPALPRVLLIGDSIVSGYGSRVADRLKGKANVDIWTTPNWLSLTLSRQAADVLRAAHYSVIHFNESGLHAWAPGRIPEGQYGPLMLNYIDVLRHEDPNVKLIWASTTPVTKAGAPGSVDPLDTLITDRNAICAPIMREKGVPIDDLHSLMMAHLDLARGDRFHWVDKGYDLMADSVAEQILERLSPASN